MMILSPVGIVVLAFSMFPEVVKEPLPVAVSIEGYLTPAQVDASVVQFRAGRGEVLEPYVTVTNTAEFELNSVYVTLNRRFVFHSANTLQPGESRDFFLSRFQEHDGSPFWPHKYDIQRVTVKGRLPSLKQAMYEVEWSEFTSPPKDKDSEVLERSESADPATEEVEQSPS